MKSNHPLLQFRDELSGPDEGYGDPGMYARLSIVEFGGLVHVDYCGSPFSSVYSRYLQILNTRAVAETLASIVLRSPDTGANGTCNWDLGELIRGDVEFPKLELFAVQQNSPGDHNRKILASMYEEEGILGTLLRKAPNLDALVAPSAPDASFFEVREHPLRHLNVDAGFDTQSFIANLASSSSFPGLRSLEWGEYNETYMDTFPQGCTPFADYCSLFGSPAFAQVNAFTLRNPVCTTDQIATLRNLRPRSSGLQFKIVRCSAEYVGTRPA